MKVVRLLFWGIVALLFSGALGVTWLSSTFPKNSDPTFGITFSKKQADLLNLDWKDTYIAILDELKIKDIRLVAYWDEIEKTEGQYDFSDIDYQLSEARERNIPVILALGYKLPRWPECHVPEWARGLSLSEQYDRIAASIPVIVGHLQNFDNIWAWQVENEPFFRFGECPTWWISRKQVDREIALVRSLDSRSIIVSESGEGDLWVKAAKRADIVGTTVYRTVWSRTNLRYSYPFRPGFYRAKANLVARLFKKPVAIVEFQMEPWSPTNSLRDFPLDKQFETFPEERFQENLNFARDIGLSPVYLWGAEWWYWLKTEQGRSTLWEEAKDLW
jgi:hypothetical protein